MVRILALLLAVLMLAGCGRQETSPSETEATTPSISETQPTEEDISDFPMYEPRSTVEKLTDGAVKRYPLSQTAVYSLIPMGEGMLLLSGEEETTLTYISQQEEAVSCRLDCFLVPDDATMQITDSQIGYYDGKGNIVMLNRALEEIRRVKLPEEMYGLPVLSPDLKYVYYFDTERLWCLEPETGITRFLKECRFSHQETVGIHFDGTVLECNIIDDTVEQCLYVATATGETLYVDTVIPSLYTSGEQYLAQWQSGVVEQLIFGKRGEKRSCLHPLASTFVTPVPALSGLITGSCDSTGSILDYYDLETGTRSGSVRLSMIGSPWSIRADASGTVWFLAEDFQDGKLSMYSWNPDMSETTDSHVYSEAYYTALEPDTEGLAACKTAAKKLGESYGLSIRVWEDATQAMPDDYTFVEEYLVGSYTHYLEELEAVLARYPKGFFTTLGESSDNGVLTISLVREIHGSNELGSLDQADGIHFWLNGSSYVTLAMGDYFEQTLYHEVFHAVDSYILTEYLAFDNWEFLNPDGFAYDQSYITNQYREDTQYLEGENRAFIDLYSMSFAKEDRARIMEYAMLPDKEEYFASDTMQKKLRTICDGMRQAFSLELAENLPWEQYLQN